VQTCSRSVYKSGGKQSSGPIRLDVHSSDEDTEGSRSSTNWRPKPKGPNDNKEYKITNEIHSTKTYTLTAKFHYASWFGAGSKLVRTR